MVKFKGSSSLKKYMREKPVTNGWKFWMLCRESCYNLKFQIYAGKIWNKTETRLGKRVVIYMWNGWMCMNVWSCIFITALTFFVILHKLLVCIYLFTLKCPLCHPSVYLLLYLLLPSQFPFPCVCQSQFICLCILLNGPMSKLYFTFMR
jgi:hypothetical protein